MMIVSAPPIEESMSRKRKRETEEGSLSAEAVSEANLKEISPMVLARWKSAAYRGNSTSRKMMDVAADVEDRPDPEPVTEKNFRSQRVKIKEECTSG